MTGLGKGERIYAVRFLGDRGYVVTFRQVDPLYTLDLRDPERPRVRRAEGHRLSSYLHPVSDTLLLGIGQDATEQGRTLGTQVSLFDVSDPAPPRLVGARVARPGASAAEQDHHAFLWWRARAPGGLAARHVRRASRSRAPSASASATAASARSGASRTRRRGRPRRAADRPLGRGREPAAHAVGDRHRDEPLGDLAPLAFTPLG